MLPGAVVTDAALALEGWFVGALCNSRVLCGISFCTFRFGSLGAMLPGAVVTDAALALELLFFLAPKL